VRQNAITKKNGGGLRLRGAQQKLRNGLGLSRRLDARKSGGGWLLCGLRCSHRNLRQKCGPFCWRGNALLSRGHQQVISDRM
jgi:hypothetical protein